MKKAKSRDEGLIGIWWYTTEKEIWTYPISVDEGVLDGFFVQYSDTENHLNMWENIVQDYVDDLECQKEIIGKGFKYFERGRVVYNTAVQCYQVFCSSTLVKDKNFQNECVRIFSLSNCRHEFIPLSHYYTAELTGNPTLDEFYYNNQY